MLEHVAAVDGVKARVQERQLLAGAVLVVDLKAACARVRASRLKRAGRWIDAGHAGAERGELLGQKAAAAADIEDLEAHRIDPELLGEDALHVAEPGGGSRAQHGGKSVFVPPAVAQAVVDGVVDRHDGLLLG